MRPAPPSGALALRALLAAIPLVALTIAVPLANRAEPRIFGFPFLMVWIMAWVLSIPAFLWMVGRVERRW
ncbi:MAG: DUF3311 domain-containing protein [Candidatus Cybelea sp.]